MIILTFVPITFCLVFGFAYPLLFWSNYRTPIDRSFYRFNLGMSCFLAGLGIIALWWIPIADTTKILALAWWILLFAVTAFFWNKEMIREWVISLPCILGAVVFLQVQNQMLAMVHPLTEFNTWAVAGTSLLGSLILSAAIFAGVLGHWYLNVKTMPTEYLMRATNVFGGLLLLRLCADVYFFISSQVIHQGEPITLASFIVTIEGVLLLLALFFGTIFALILVPFIRETIKIKNTQSATGILYVVAISVLIGDLAYRYYLLQYGVTL